MFGIRKNFFFFLRIKINFDHAHFIILLALTDEIFHIFHPLTFIETVLGYIQRGGTPSPMDRVLATRYGSAAADLIAERDFGKMVALRNTEIVSVPLSEVSGKLKLVDPKDPLVIQAQKMGTSFGV